MKYALNYAKHAVQQHTWTWQECSTHACSLRACAFPFGASAVNVFFLLHKYLCLHLQTERKSDPTGLTGHSVNNASLNSLSSQTRHLQQVATLSSSFKTRRRSRLCCNENLWDCLSLQCLCLFIGWSLKFLQYLSCIFVCPTITGLRQWRLCLTTIGGNTAAEQCVRSSAADEPHENPDNKGNAEEK